MLKEAFKDEKGNGRHPDMMWFNETFRYGNGYDARGLLFSSVSIPTKNDLVPKLIFFL